MLKKDIYIGTSGWQYSHWRGNFYPQNMPPVGWLRFYMHVFNTVEVNSTFYRIPKQSIFEKWAKDGKVFPKFKFSIKLNMLFTRHKRLALNKEEELVLHEFLENCAILGKNLGPILIQLPPGLRANQELLEKFVQNIIKFSRNIERRKNNEAEFLFALEFRHATWYNPETYALLKKFNIASVIGDTNRWAIQTVKTADWVYLRFHGVPKLYTSNYEDVTLRKWVHVIKNFNPTRAYIYFNNDAAGHAPPNAMTIGKMFGIRKTYYPLPQQKSLF